MTIPEHDRILIKKRAKFLEVHGYELTREDTHVIQYSRNEVIISVVYEPYEEWVDIGVKFLKENEGFDLSRIVLGAGGMSLKHREDNHLKKILGLLEYLENHFDEVIDIKYCREAERKAMIHFS